MIFEMSFPINADVIVIACLSVFASMSRVHLTSLNSRHGWMKGYLDLPRGGGGGDSHMKQTGMLVVSLRGVNFGFWSRLGCSGQSANILCRQGLV